MGNKSNASDQLLNTLLLSQQIQQRQQQLGSSTTESPGLQPSLSKSSLNAPSTPAANGANLQNNPLLLSHLLSMNHASKQSVIDPSNLDARALSAHLAAHGHE